MEVSVILKRLCKLLIKFLKTKFEYELDSDIYKANLILVSIFKPALKISDIHIKGSYDFERKR